MIDLDCLSNLYDPRVYDPEQYNLVAYYDNGRALDDSRYLIHSLMHRGRRYMLYITGGPDCWLSIEGKPVRMIRPQSEAQAWAWLRQNHRKIRQVNKDEWAWLFAGFVMGVYEWEYGGQVLFLCAVYFLEK